MQFINDLFSDNIFPSISVYSDSSSIDSNTGLAALVVNTIIQHGDRLLLEK